MRWAQVIVKRVMAITAVAALAVLSPRVVVACESCFGSAVDTEVTRGIGAAMTLLLLVIVTVFAAIIWFFKNMMDRSRKLREGMLIPPAQQQLLPPTALN